MKLPIIKNAKDFQKYYIMFLHNQEILKFDEIVQLVSLIGQSQYKKNQCLNTKQFFFNSFKALQQKSQFEKINENMEQFAQLIIQFGNVSLSENQLFERFSLNIDENQLQTQTLIPLYWAYINIKCDSNNIQNRLFKIILQKLKNFNESQLLNLLWILSYNNDIDYEIINQILILYEKNSYKMHSNLVNKRQGQICQIMINFYPQLKNQLFENKHFKLEDFLQLNQKIQLNNKFYEQFLISRFLFNRKNKYEYITYLQKKDYYNIKKIESYENYQNITFEDNVENLLVILEMKYQRNIKYGMYEIDFLIQNKALEVNGEHHFIFELDKNSNEFNQLYDNRIKQVYIKKIIKYSWFGKYMFSELLRVE